MCINIHWYLYCTVYIVSYFHDSMWVFFEWKRICTSHILFVYICIADGNPMIPLTGLAPPHVVSRSEANTSISISICRDIFLCSSILDYRKISTLDSNSLKNNMMVRLFVFISRVTCTYFPKYCAFFDIFPTLLH